MDSDVRAIMHECTQASGEERISFGQVVMTLTRAGIERYHVDFVRAVTTYYLPDGETEAVQAHVVSTAPAKTFSAAGVEAAVRAIQSGAIQYRAFCERVLEAGCVGYLASMAGRRVVYYGRTGDLHIERFPGSD